MCWIAWRAEPGPITCVTPPGGVLPGCSSCPGLRGCRGGVCSVPCSPPQAQGLFLQTARRLVPMCPGAVPCQPSLCGGVKGFISALLPPPTAVRTPQALSPFPGAARSETPGPKPPKCSRLFPPQPGARASARAEGPGCESSPRGLSGTGRGVLRGSVGRVGRGGAVRRALGQNL